VSVEFKIVQRHRDEREGAVTSIVATVSSAGINLAIKEGEGDEEDKLSITLILAQAAVFAATLSKIADVQRPRCAHE
jgi:hypothetical protein